MPRSAAIARQEALAKKKAEKEEKEAAKEAAEAKRKAEAQAKKAAKEAEEDADDEDDENEQPPVTPAKGKRKGKNAAPTGKTPKKAKAAALNKGKAAAAQKGKDAADDEDNDEEDDEEDVSNDEQPPATPKGKGKGKKAAPEGKATPKKAPGPEKAPAPRKAAAPRTAARKKAPAPRKAALPKKANNASPKRAENAVNVTNEKAAMKTLAAAAAAAAGRKRTSAEMMEDGNEEDKEEGNEDLPGEGADEDQAQQSPAKKVRTGFSHRTPMARKTVNAIAKITANPNANHRKQLAGNKTFLIPRKSAPARRRTSSSEWMTTSGSGDRTGRGGDAAHHGAGRSAREGQGKQMPKRWREKNNKNDKKKLPPVRVRVRNGMGGVQEREVEFDDDERPGRGQGRGRVRGEEGEEEEEEAAARREAEEEAAARREAEAEAASRAARAERAAAAADAEAAAGGNPDDDEGDDDKGDDDEGPSDSSDNSSASSSPSMTSEQLQRHLPVLEDERITSRLAQLKQSYYARKNRAKADRLPYTQGVFARATGEKYGDPVTPEDLKRDFAHLKFLVQKFVDKVPTDNRTMEELDEKVPSVWAEMRRMTRNTPGYWRIEPSPLRKWLLEALVWRRLHRLMFDRTLSEYFAFGHGKAMLTELWVASLAAGEVFEEAMYELCEQRARLATFLKEMYEKESPTRMARAFDQVFSNGILDFFRERYQDYVRDEDEYFYEERAERERELQDLGVQIIAHASDLNSRMLRSSGNWALTYTDPRYEERMHGYDFKPDKMHLRDLEDEYVVRENPTGDLGELQRKEEGTDVRLAITPGLWDFTEWAIIDPPYTVPHVRSEVSMFRHLLATKKKERAAEKAKGKDARGRRGR